jgi:hypothetical protein
MLCFSVKNQGMTNSQRLYRYYACNGLKLLQLKNMDFKTITKFVFDHVVAWLRRYATSQKVVGSNEDDVNGFLVLNLPIPSSCSMALWLTQPLTDMSTTNLSGAGGYSQHIRLTASLLSVSRLCRQCGILDILQSYRPP